MDILVRVNIIQFHQST